MGAPGGSGFTRVFKWDAAKASWLRMGVDIGGPSVDSGLGLGAVVSVSLDGDQLLVAAPGAGIARAYKWDRASGGWLRMGADLTAGTDAGGVEQIALSGDGTHVAIAAPAAENGVVAYAGNEIRGFGNLLLIKHADGYVTAYAHNRDLLVRRGQRVRRGQKIATVGQTGSVNRPQLHFEIRKGRRPKNPEDYLRGA